VSRIMLGFEVGAVGAVDCTIEEEDGMDLLYILLMYVALYQYRVGRMDSEINELSNDFQGHLDFHPLLSILPSYPMHRNHRDPSSTSRHQHRYLPLSHPVGR
jgi:hypothetical protein